MHKTKYMWNTTDPSTGYSFKIWKRVDLGFSCANDSLACEDECDKLGGIVGKDRICHTYDLIDRVCIKIDM